MLQLYVGEGAVGWGPRLRLWATTEITRITLVPAQTGDAVESHSLHSSQSGAILGMGLMVLSGLFVCVSRIGAALHDLSSMRANSDTNNDISAIERSKTSIDTVALGEGPGDKGEGDEGRQGSPAVHISEP
eukprot:COSAG02_NODE_188_length_30307_cov_341.858746_26_plen_131_part_00